MSLKPANAPAKAPARFHIASSLDLTLAVAGVLSWPPLRNADPVDRSQIGTIAAELGSNILKYGKSGWLTLGLLEQGDAVDVEVSANDNGPGIQDIEQALQEHFSSGGTLGLGLPGVRRMADAFDIQSAPGAGTRVRAIKRIHGKRKSPALPERDWRLQAASADRGSLRAPHASLPELRRAVEHGSNLRICPGEQVCGDQTLVQETRHGYLVALIDGGGHGHRAHELATALCQVARDGAGSEPGWIMEQLHRRARGSVGAAVGLAQIDLERRSLNCLAVGNVSVLVLGPHPWRCASMDGVLGTRLPTPRTQSVSFGPGQMVLMHSDGLPEAGIGAQAARLRALDPASLSRRLVSTLAKPYDDASCVALKWNA